MNKVMEEMYVDSSNIQDSKEKLSKFLKDICVKIDRNEMSQEQLRYVSEFLMYYKFKEQFGEEEFSEDDDGGDNIDGDVIAEDDEGDGNVLIREFMKFFILGWYVYTNLN